MTMTFPADLGAIACQCVISGARPVLAVSHSGGDWQMYCDWQSHDFRSPDITMELKLVHVAHLLAQDPTLEAVADLPIDMGAERPHVGGAWQRFDDGDDAYPYSLR